MKVGIRRLLSIVSCAVFALTANASLFAAPAQAASQSYLFYYTRSDVQTIRNALDSNNFNDAVSAMSATAVWVKGLAGESSPLPLTISTSPVTTPSTPGNKTFEYQMTYVCSDKKYTTHDQGVGDYSITIKADVRIPIAPAGSPQDFTSLTNLPGTISFVSATHKQRSQTTGRGGSSVVTTTDADLSSIPSECLPNGVKGGAQSVNFANYTKLASPSSSWPGVKSSTQVSVDRSADPSSGGSSENAADTCAASDTAGNFGWILCPAIDLANSTIEKIGHAPILAALQINPLSPDSSDGRYQLWKIMRNIANVGFVIIFLVIIFSNTLGVGLNNYNAKKMLPRLVAGVILVQFSFIFCAVVIDASNILGTGLGSLLDAIASAPATATHDSVFSYTGAVAVDLLVTSAIILVVGVPTLALLAITILFSILAVFITVTVRQLILTFLIVISPLAFVAWVMPGTEKYFDMWSKNLIRLALMDPLIVLLLSIGGILSSAASSYSSGNSASDTINMLISAAFPTISFFMIPMTFKMSGGMMTFASGQLYNRTKSVGGKVTNSQAAKDWQQSYRDKGAMRFANSNSRVARGIGFLQTGSVVPTRGARIRAMGAANKAIANRSDNINEGFDNLAQTNTPAQMDHILTELAQGRNAGGMKADYATRSAAIKRLIKQNRWDALRQVQRTQHGSNIWSSAIKDDFGDIRKAAPDITGRPGDFGSLASVTASNFNDLHQSTINAAFDPSRSAAERQAAAAAILPTFQTILADPRLQQKMRPEVLAALKNHAAEFGPNQAVIDNNLNFMDSVDPNTGAVIPNGDTTRARF